MAHLGKDPGRKQNHDEGRPSKEGPLDVLVADATTGVPVGAGAIASAHATTLVVVVCQPAALFVDITDVSLSLQDLVAAFIVREKIARSDVVGSIDALADSFQAG